MPGLGDTIILPKPGHATEHLWALVTAPDPQSGQAIMVNLTSQRKHSDLTVVLQPGDHPFVQHPTVVFYADARLVTANALAGGIRQGIVRPHATLLPAVLQRIQNGLMDSPYTPAKIKTAFGIARQQGLV